MGLKDDWNSGSMKGVQMALNTFVFWDKHKKKIQIGAVVVIVLVLVLLFLRWF